MVLCFCNYASWTPAACPDRPSPRRPNPRQLRRPPLARYRTVPRRPHRRRRRHPRPAQRLLHRRQQRRRLEDRRLRPHLEADLRRPAHRLDRRHRRRAVRPQHHLRGQRRRPAAARSFRRRRHVQEPPTAARPGATSACATGSRSPRSWSIRAIPTACSSPCSGHPYGPNAERGVFRSTDGGADLAEGALQGRAHRRHRPGLRPAQSADRLRRAVAGAAGALGERRVLRARTAACSNPPTAAPPGTRSPAACPPSRKGSAASASASRPATPIACTPWWKPAAKPAALYRSDDAGATWKRVNGEQRIYGRGADFACVRVDPKNKDVIYVANTSTYRSTDAGQSFTAIKGAPGGDDYHTIWINPEQPQHHPAGRRPGRHHQRERRPHLELLVQPADRAVLPRHHRQPVSLLGLRRAAGERLGGHRQPRQRRRRSPSATGIPWAPRSTATSRPTRSNPNIIYGGDMRRRRVTRYDRITGEVEHLRPRGKYRYLRTDRRCVLAQSIRTCLYVGTQYGAEDHRRRQDTGKPSAPTSRAKPTTCPPASASYRRRRQDARPRAAAWSTPSRPRA